MTTHFAPLFPGMLLDAAARYALDAAAAPVTNADVLQDFGWTAILVPEAAGGVGAGLVDLASIVEGLAAQDVNLPVVPACAIAPLLLQAGAANGWPEQLADGRVRVLPLMADAGLPNEPGVEARASSGGFTLHGSVLGADRAHAPTHWIVPVWADGEAAIFLLDAAQVGTPHAYYRSLDGARVVAFKFAGLHVPRTVCLARGDMACATMARATEAALLLSAVDTVSALAALIQQVIEHLQTRRQFGVALSSFQALRHRVAEMYVKYRCAKGLLMHCVQEQEHQAVDLHRSLRLAMVSLAETARFCAEAAIQLQGGMGMSEEVLATRLARRLLAAEFRHGDRLSHAAHLLSHTRAAPIGALRAA